MLKSMQHHIDTVADSVVFTSKDCHYTACFIQEESTDSTGTMLHPSPKQNPDPPQI
jgi:hypothetical protein